MAKRIVLKENGVSGYNPPPGYRFIGFSGITFSNLDSSGNINEIGGGSEIGRAHV